MAPGMQSHEIQATLTAAGLRRKGLFKEAPGTKEPREESARQEEPSEILEKKAVDGDGSFTNPPLPVAIFYVMFAQGLLVLPFLLPPFLIPISLRFYRNITVAALLVYYAHVGFSRMSATGFRNRCHWFSEDSIIGRMSRRYHEFTEYVEAECISRKQILIACHPHGVLGDYRMLLDGVIEKKFTNIKSLRILAAGVLFYIPIVRELILGSGCIDASRENAEAALKKGHSLMLAPGGEAEQMMTTYGKEVLYLRRRKGFVRLAIIYGVPIVPLYVFGTNDLYKTSTFLYNFRYWVMRKYRMAFPLFIGRWWTLGPLNRRLTAVFGKPIHFEKNLEPTQAQIDAAHELYIQRLQELFDANKERSGYGDRTLEIL